MIMSGRWRAAISSPLQPADSALAAERLHRALHRANPLHCGGQFSELHIRRAGRPNWSANFIWPKQSAKRDMESLAVPASIG